MDEIKEEKKMHRKEIGNKIKSFFMKSTNGMAIGLFGTLIIGTILDLFAKIPGLSVISSWSTIIKGLMGAGIGLGVALSMNKKGVAVVAIMAAGAIGGYMFDWLPGNTQFTVVSISDPLSCYISSLICLFAVDVIMRKKTPVDLILIPLVGLVLSMIYSLLLAEWVHEITVFISWIIKQSFSLNGALSFLMCIIVSALVGMALTSPLSSVAICVAIQIGATPLASAAALIGCSTQMVGFAVQAAHDNKWGSVIAIGIGTSMLEFKNIIRKPVIWLPTIIVSAILGPLAMLFPLNGDYSASVSALSVAAGMGTSGLVGPLNMFSVTNYDWVVILEVIAFAIVIPGILVFLLDLFFRKMKWINKGDFALNNDL